jgi:transposase
MAPSGSLEQDAPAALPAYAATIGIDWGDQKQYYTLRPAHELGKLQRGSFATAQLGQWVLDLRQRFSHGRIAVALEHGRSALLYALMEQTDFIDLYLIAPKASASYREAFASSGAKADNTDADAIEDMLCHHRGQLRRWQPEDAATRLLEALCRQRRHAVEERTALSNQLVAQLKLCYPVALELSREVANPMLLELLQRWPTLAKLRAAKPSTLKSFFYLHHVRRPKCIERRLELIAQAGTLVHDAAILLAAQLEVRRLVGQLRALLPFIADYDRRIAELYETHADAPIFKSLPGAGPALGPRLLCAMGTVRERWPDAQSIQKFSGLAPVRKASGKSYRVLKRCACPKYLRQSFQEFAAASVKFCPWARELYERLLAAGKSYHTAVRTVAFRWLRIIWRMWQDKTCYTESIFTKAQQKHQRTLQFNTTRQTQCE